MDCGRGRAPRTMHHDATGAPQPLLSGPPPPCPPASDSALHTGISRAMSALEAVRAIVRADCAGWGGVDPQAVQVESTDATEWHTVLFLTSPAAVSEQQADDGAEKPPRQLLRKLVANIPSWRGATLLNKAAASRHLGAVGLAPAVLGELELLMPPAAAAAVSGSSGSADAGAGSREPLPLHVSEYVAGGCLQRGDDSPATMAQLGQVYGRLHSEAGTGWFRPVAAALREEGLLPAGQQAEDWAVCSWGLPWLQRLIPAETRDSLTSQGVDWGFIEREISALPECPLLPETRTVTVHGDVHEGNLVWGAAGGGQHLKLIDFDMTAVGPAGVCDLLRATAAGQSPEYPCSNIFAVLLADIVIVAGGRHGPRIFGAGTLSLRVQHDSCGRDASSGTAAVRCVLPTAQASGFGRAGRGGS